MKKDKAARFHCTCSRMKAIFSVFAMAPKVSTCQPPKAKIN
jgi:hypothetical protein